MAERVRRRRRKKEEMEVEGGEKVRDDGRRGIERDRGETEARSGALQYDFEKKRDTRTHTLNTRTHRNKGREEEKDGVDSIRHTSPSFVQ